MNYSVTGEQLTGIADAIRAKTGGSAGLEFPDDFVSGIGGLTDTSDANATAGDILSGKTAYVNGSKLTGSYVPLDTSDATATASDILPSKTAYVNGSKITGKHRIGDVTEQSGKTFGSTITGSGVTFRAVGSASTTRSVAPVSPPSGKAWRLKTPTAFSVYGISQTLSNFTFVRHEGQDDYLVYSTTGSDITIQKPSGSPQMAIVLTADVYEVEY